MSDFDLVALGGGAGGLAAVRAATLRGKRAAMVVDGPIGGDCTWTGCVPSKTLIEAAAQGLDFSAAMARVRATVERIAGTESAEVLEQEGVTVIDGRGVLVDARTVEVAGRRVQTTHIVLAMGSQPAQPPIPGLGDVDAVTTDTVWALDRAPARLAVLGGGATGCELAQAFARLGVDVTLFEIAGRLLPGEEPESSDAVRAALLADGVTVRTSSPVAQVARTLEGGVRVTADGGDVVVDRVLVALGRTPATDGVGLESAGVELAASGHVQVNRKLQTSVSNIWAVGDVNGLLPFTHAADEQGRLAAWAALGSPLRWTFDPARVPRVFFTSPEVARVGVVESEAPRGARVAYLPMAENDRALAAGRVEGFIKLIAAPRRVLRRVGGGRIVGATVVGERAGELIHEPALVMLTGSFTGRLAQLGHAYPTWSVGIQKCAGQFFQPVEGRQARPARPSPS